MSPPTTYGTGGTPAVNVNTPHVPLPTPRPAGDLLERIEAAHARRAIRSPIQPPPGGWAARPCPDEHGYSEPTKRRHVGTPRAKWDVDRAITLAQQGQSAQQIATAVGASPRTVRDTLARRGVTVIDSRTGTTLDVAELARLAAQGMTRTQIADALGCGTTTVGTHARAAGITLARPTTAPRPRPAAEDNRPELREQWATFQRLAADGATAAQIAQTLGISLYRVRRDAKAAGITLTRGTSTGRPSHWDIDHAITLAGKGLTAREIAEQVGASTVTVRRVLGRHGVTLTDGRTKYSGGQNSLRRRGDVDPQHVRDLYEQHGNTTHVARLLGCSPQTVARILTDLDVHIRSSGDVQRGRPGADHAAHLKALMREHGTTPVEVRTWGATHGYDVARNGIPSRAVVDAYLAAHQRDDSTTHPTQKGHAA